MKPIMLTHFFRQHFTRLLALMLLVTASTMANSQAKGVIDASGTPHEVVESVTEHLLAFFKDNNGRLSQDPTGYYSDVRKLLEPVIAFPYIARNVMSRYWSYASPEQRKMFVEVFTENLVETYVKGMANYAKYDVSVVPPKEKEDVAKAGTVNVIQLVKDTQGETKVVYNLRRKNQQSNWQLVNVWLGSSNLGKSLQSQFDGAVKANLPKSNDGQKISKDQVSSAIAAAIQGWGKA